MGEGYQPKVYQKQGGDELVVAAGGKIIIESGGVLELDDTELEASAEELNLLSGAGAVVASGTPVSNIADASTSHDLNATFSDTEVETALNALGTKVNSILTALESFGIVLPAG